MRIFTFPYNYEGGAAVYEADADFNQGDAVPALTDGRTDTFSTSERFIVDFPGTAARTLNAIFVEVFGFDDVSLTADSDSAVQTLGGFAINTAAQERGGRHYAFAPFFNLQANRVRVSFGGAPGRVFRIAIVRQLLNITEPNWTAVALDRVGEGNDRRLNINGNAIVIPNRAGRWKWHTDLTGYYPPNANPSVEQLLATLERAPNFFVYPFPTEYPTVFYPANIDFHTVGIQWRGGFPQQRNVSFVLREL